MIESKSYFFKKSLSICILPLYSKNILSLSIIKSLSKKMNDLSVPLVIIPGLISEKELDNLI